MEKRILHLNDIHSREKDFSTVKGYVDVLEVKFDMLLKLKRELDLYGIIINGDLSDGGYQDKVIKDSHMNYIRELKKGLKIFALNVGNHFFIERDSNIELYLIQPSDKYPMRRRHYASEPVLSTPDRIIVDKVQFSLFHYSRKNKLYVRGREPGITHHVGLYHDEVVLPKTIRDDMHIPVKVSSNYFKQIFANVDEGICAHIHKPFGTQFIDVDGRVVPMHIPGSFSITEHSAVEVHEHVNLPMHTINGDEVRIDFLPFPTLIKELRFIKSKEKEKKEIEHTVKEAVFVADAVSTANAVKYDLNRKLALIPYLTGKGYKPAALEIIQLAMEGALTQTDAIKLQFQLNKQLGLGGLLDE